MELIVVRHAIAEERRPGLSDAERALTPDGRRRMRLAVRGLQRLGLRLGHVYHSPLRRAVQTAELLAPVMRDARDELSACAGLADEPTLELLTELRGERVAAVGHEPWTGQLVSWLVEGTPAADSGFALRKGGVAWLEGRPEPGGMRVVALLAPKLLRRIGRD